MTGNSYRYEYDRGRRVEVLATWYLRFHGYLTTPHFVLHKPDGTQYTDADILGVRFPHSAEDVVSGGPDPALDVRDDLIDVVIAECSADQAKFNKPWKEEFDRHLQYVLRYIGIFPRENLSAISGALRDAQNRQYEWVDTLGVRCRVRFVLFAMSPGDPALRTVKRIELPGALEYLGGRFHSYPDDARSAHSQWDPFINELYSRLRPKGDASPEPIGQTLNWLFDRTPASGTRGGK